MFLIQRPSAAQIERFLIESRGLPLSYDHPGLIAHPPPRMHVDEQTVTLGHGVAAFAAARDALRAWKQFEFGWVEVFPRSAPISAGTNVAILVRHLGFWSLNGARIVYEVGDGESCCGFAYGTLTNHAESGEELFEVALDPTSSVVTYRIRAVSSTRAALATLGTPVARALQARFRRDSAAAMKRAVRYGLSSGSR